MRRVLCSPLIYDKWQQASLVPDIVCQIGADAFGTLDLVEAEMTAVYHILCRLASCLEQRGKHPASVLSQCLYGVAATWVQGIF